MCLCDSFDGVREFHFAPPRSHTTLRPGTPCTQVQNTSEQRDSSETCGVEPDRFIAAGWVFALLMTPR